MFQGHRPPSKLQKAIASFKELNFEGKQFNRKKPTGKRSLVSGNKRRCDDQPKGYEIDETSPLEIEVNIDDGSDKKKKLKHNKTVSQIDRKRRRPTKDRDSKKGNPRRVQTYLNEPSTRFDIEPVSPLSVFKLAVLSTIVSLFILTFRSIEERLSTIHGPEQITAQFWMSSALFTVDDGFSIGIEAQAPHCEQIKGFELFTDYGPVFEALDMFIDDFEKTTTERKNSISFKKSQIDNCKEDLELKLSSNMNDDTTQVLRQGIEALFEETPFEVFELHDAFDADNVLEQELIRSFLNCQKKRELEKDFVFEPIEELSSFENTERFSRFKERELTLKDSKSGDKVSFIGTKSSNF
ncbi:hypothetical protein WICPIJ_004237 [Wickerhamomyces pijperi]|uniref:Uncharacterized protein n=1 Tax=Wickerhamomyces pijperi TaxID=599730 RepID=A0A9P8Q5Z0_WICPI|nr:hypothetical protein WICPIJ_004237 [Wickerhamomyces pijperi]